METVTLGMTDLKVSRIAFGAWELGGEWGSVDENAAIATIRHARERGINVFDTAQAYGFGASERIVGRALRDDLDHHRERGRDRDQGWVADDRQRPGARLEPRLAPTGCRREFAGARRRLHRSVPGALARPERRPDRNRRCPRRAGRRGQDPTRRRLELRRRRDGRVRADEAGGNAAAALQLVPTGDRSRRTALHPCTRHRRAGLRTAGPRTADRDHGRTNNVRPRRLAQHQPVVPRRHIPPQSRPGTRPPTLRRRELGASVAQLAVAWTLANPAVQVAIVGARRARHIDEAITASELHLGESELTHIDRIMAGTTTFTGPSPDAMPTR